MRGDPMVPMRLRQASRGPFEANGSRLKSGGVCLLIRVSDLCRDPAAATDIKALALVPGPDVAGAGRTGHLGRTLTPATCFASLCQPRRQRVAESSGILGRE